MTRILAFDIGIKNLAWCCLEKVDKQYKILGWDNYNLLSDESNLDTKKTTKCLRCNIKAAYESRDGNVFCARHCPITQPALRGKDDTLLKKIPTADVCRDILQSRGLKVLPKKKSDMEEELGKLYCLPIVTKKVSKAPDANLSEIHTSIQKLVMEHRVLWSTCKTILLENQPAFKNPTMKSVQILLFATLRDYLENPTPILKFVHAGKKVQGAAKGDAGYKERKAGSELRVETFLKSGDILELERWRCVWEKAKKKSDLADALCMCFDAHSTSA